MNSSFLEEEEPVGLKPSGAAKVYDAPFFFPRGIARTFGTDESCFRSGYWHYFCTRNTKGFAKTISAFLQEGKPVSLKM